jgi:hypothetical protein
MSHEFCHRRTNLAFLLLASQVRLDPVAHSNEGKTSLKQLNCRKELCSKELNELQVQWLRRNVAGILAARGPLAKHKPFTDRLPI